MSTNKLAKKRGDFVLLMLMMMAFIIHRLFLSPKKSSPTTSGGEQAVSNAAQLGVKQKFIQKLVLQLASSYVAQNWFFGVEILLSRNLRGQVLTASL